MAHSRVPLEQVIEGAAHLFRTAGYEGASYSRLAEATGIEKASLYYHFPRGKDQIVEAVASHVYAWFEENIFAPARQAEIAPRKRVQQIIRGLRTFYADGTVPCVLDTLSLPGGPDGLRSALRAALHAWVEAFTTVALASGLPPRLAGRRAQQAVIQVEGSLVLARVLGDKKPFLQALAGLPALLTQA